MDERTTLHAFVAAHRGLSPAQLAQRFPAGCLLTRASSSEATPSAAEVLPLLPAQPSVPMVVGRGMDVALVVDSGRVSKQHAQFVLHGGLLLLTDLGSANGTYFNGQRMKPQQTVQIPAGTCEVWFADQQFFHFDAPALHGYIQRLGQQVPEPPAPLPPSKPDPAPTRPVTRMNETAVMKAFSLEELNDPTIDERWEAALKALRELLVNAERVELGLALQDEPVTIFDAKDPKADRAGSLAAVEGLQTMVREIKVVFQRSGLEMKLFSREAQVP